MTATRFLAIVVMGLVLYIIASPVTKFANGKGLPIIA